MVYVFMLQPVETPVRVWHKKLAYIFFSCGSSSYICLVYTYILGYSSNKPHLAAAATSKASSHHIALAARLPRRRPNRTEPAVPKQTSWPVVLSLCFVDLADAMGSRHHVQLAAAGLGERERARARQGRPRCCCFDVPFSC